MKIGITGSAGFLGANLVKYLHDTAAGDAEIVPFFSSRDSNPLTADLPLTYEHLDVTSRQEVLEKTRGIDVLFHLAGVVDYSRTGMKRNWEVNVLGTRNVFDAALENGIGKVIYASSISVLGTVAPGDPSADENHRIYGNRSNPISFADREQALSAVNASLAGDYSFVRRTKVPYFDAKLAGYELANDYHRKHNLPVVVVCPGTAVGEGDVGFSITRLIAMVFAGRLRFTLPGGTSFVSAGDVREGIWLAGLRGKNGEAYIISGTEEDNLSYGRFMELVATVANRYYGRKVCDRFITVPFPVSRALSKVVGRLLPARELNEGLLLSGSATHRFRCDKAKREIGYNPRMPLDRSIKACIDFYIRNCREGGISVHAPIGETSR